MRLRHQSLQDMLRADLDVVETWEHANLVQKRAVLQDTKAARPILARTNRPKCSQLQPE